MKQQEGLLGETEKLYRKGLNAIKNGNTLEALASFEKAFKLEPEKPRILSFLGLCIAYERGVVKEAISLCEKALQTEPQAVEHYLNLGKVYLKAGIKVKAIEILREGLKIDNKNPEIIAELQALGLRKKPVIPSLSRDNFINKYLGIILSKLGLR
jgi:tetratricopeptide (TPR) repeat protein